MADLNRTPNSNNGGGDPVGRMLPHDIDAEQALLGSLLQEESAVGDAVMVLKEAGADAFFFEQHRELYELVVALWAGRQPLDAVIIRNELQRRGRFDALGGYGFLTNLINRVPSSLRAREYAGIVRDKFLLRSLIHAANQTLDTAYQDRAPAREILDESAKRIFDVTERGFEGGAQALPSLVEEVFRKIEQMDGSVLTGEPSGYFQLDEITSGLQPGELIIVAGRPSMGKTAFGLNVAEHMALSEGRPVLFFSLEMSSQQVAQRILCSRARVDAQLLRRGRHSPRDMQRLQAVAEEIRERPLFVDDTSSLTILELRARARMAHRRHKIRAIFVDYLQLLRSPGSESRQIEVSEISRGLKALAKDLSVPVMAMAQLNRKPADRGGNRPMMSDLRESGAIEQDADLIGLLHRESYYKVGEDENAEQDNRAELIIAKQRNGPVGTIELHFNRQFTRFDNPQVGGRYENTYEAQGGSVEFPG